MTDSMKLQYQVASILDEGLPLQIIFMHPEFGKQNGSAQQAQAEQLESASKNAGFPGRVALVWPVDNSGEYKFIAPPFHCPMFEKKSFNELLALRNKTLEVTANEVTPFET